MDSELIRKSKAFAEDVFKDRAFEKRSFHNIGHTQEVVRATREIGLQSELNDDEMESAIIAAWLHDTGYLEGSNEHERKAADKVKTLLDDWGASHKKIMEVTEAILSTKVPQQPQSLISKVLCDADLHHLSADTCQERANQLRDEWEKAGDKKLTDAE